VDTDSAGLAGAIREFRRRDHLTQAALASDLGCSEIYIRKLEHGRPCGPGTLRKLAAAMRKARHFDLARYVEHMLVPLHDFEEWRSQATRENRMLQAQIMSLGNSLLVLKGEVDILKAQSRPEKGWQQ
jgi:transcriptional regulator with XRE-family HTH domain